MMRDLLQPLVLLFWIGLPVAVLSVPFSCLGLGMGTSLWAGAVVTAMGAVVLRARRRAG